ncbi:MAG TPA: hypothetical protein VIS99_14360 [Terrimicrobiaceae bacterium]
MNSSLTLNFIVPALATNCVVIGHCSKADCVWTRDDFLTICELMLNGNAPSDFMLVYRDKENEPRFAKSKSAKAERRASWAWDTIAGRAKSKVGIGFYPSNREGKTRWGAMDFDAHDGNALRARGLSLAAFEVLHRQPQLYVILGTSGSDGWHLFVFTQDFHPTGEWTLLLKKVCEMIGTEIKPGICEIFPHEVKAGSLSYAIRAPGTWNPKGDSLGLIAYSSITPLLFEARKERKDYPFLCHATNRVDKSQSHDREKVPFYRGAGGEWKVEFAITQSSTRHNQLKGLVHHIFRQVGREVARRNAEAQYNEATPRPRATLSEHLSEFDALWGWTTAQWRAELTDCEQQQFARLSTETERDAFRIVRSFARKAIENQSRDFPLSVEHVAAAIGVCHQAIGKLRKRFAAFGIIEKTADHIVNRTAARFRWLLPGRVP